MLFLKTAHLNQLPLIIDWEHFYDEGELWGFDIAYLTLSSLILPYLSNKSFCKKDLFIFQKLWSSLKDLGVSNDLIHEPISFFNEIFSNQEHWAKIINESPNKLFTNLLSNEFIKSFERDFLKDI